MIDKILICIVGIATATVDPEKTAEMKSALDHIVFADRHICAALSQVHWVEPVAEFVLLLCLHQHRSACVANRHRMTHSMISSVT